jgi:hypothetical protein
MKGTLRALVAAALLAALGAAPAGAVPRLEMQQVDVRGLPTLRLELTARDAAGEPLPGLRAEDFRLYLDGELVQGLSMASSDAQGRRAVVFVLESSSRLLGRDFFQARAMVSELADRLAASDRTALVSASEPGSPKLGLTEDKARLRRALGEIGVEGESVSLNRALQSALAELRDAPEPSRAIVLVASGQGISDPELREDVLARARELQIPIHAVAASLRFEGPVLPAYAERTGGRYYPEPASTNAADLARRGLASGSGRYSGAVRLAVAPDGRPHHAVLELSLLGQSVQEELSFLMTPEPGISTEAINDYYRRAGARQGWWMVYFGAIVGGIAFVALRDRLGLRGAASRLLVLAIGLATGALLGFVLSRLAGD